MTNIDYNDLKFYETLGFKSGVEIHQQILTDRKLFCKCPAGKYSKLYDAEVLRHMRPTLSELGEYDGCALMEFKTKKEVVYRLNRESVCTYEMDDTPPFLVNQQGLDIAIEIALLFNCSIVDEMHISRKQYLDGSIPAGFQRTSVVGVNGWIPYKDRKIGISHICYEEDACRQISNVGHRITFKTDRLGMPLIEVITLADMKTPQEVAEVVTEIGRLVRATGKVRRGLGSVRQDVNASIAGGSRVEMKGVPQISWIPRLLHNEALRQKGLLDIKQILAKRNITVETLNTPKADLTKTLSNSHSEIIKQNISNGKTIGGIKLTGLNGIFNRPTQPTKTFADEVIGRLRVIACLDVMPNLFHTDNYPAYEGSKNDIELINKELKLTKNDLGVILWGTKQDVNTALDEIRLRIIDAINGVPNETKQPFKNGLTDFERILPGANRMYPDTDSPPVKITAERVENIRKHLPEPPWQKEKRFLALGMSYNVARDLAISPMAPVAEKIMENRKFNPTLVGAVLTQQLTALKRKGIDITTITDKHLTEIFELHNKGVITRNAIPILLEKLAGKKSSIQEIIKETNLESLPETKYPELIKQALQGSEFNHSKKVQTNQTEKKVRFYAGSIMKKHHGKLSGKSLIPHLEKAIKA